MKKYCTKQEAAQLIVEIGRRMYDKSLVAANDGNISVKIGDEQILTTPTGVSKGFMKVEDLVLVNGFGQVLEGNLKPSSELKMHLRVYAENPLVGAVTHAHPPFATAFAVAGLPLDPVILTEAVVNLGIIPLAGYATPSTQEVAAAVAPFCRDYNGLLLANHGALSWGKDLLEAYFRLEQMEYLAKVTVISQQFLGRSHKLSNGQISRLLEIRAGLGISSGGVPVGVAEPCNLADLIAIL